MNEEKIGDFISLLRKEKGMTQGELARIINVTDKAVSKWETGKGCPDISILIPLSEALGVSVNELLVGERVNDSKKVSDNLELTIKLSEMSRKKLERNVIYIVSSFVFITLLLLFLNGSFSPIGVLEILTIIIVLLGFRVYKKRSLNNLLPMMLLMFYTFYSFFTYTGSVRLEILLMGHPVKAYTTNLKENESRREYNIRYYENDSDIKVISGSMGFIKCQNYYGFKISSYYGF